ncbi:uncharacterized protein [Ptychodera flava]|uniref:uncharacterized protein n=1 Tax=Ptychodera flava TaxID=63121 RepID=UPI00396A9131
MATFNHPLLQMMHSRSARDLPVSENRKRKSPGKRHRSPLEDDNEPHSKQFLTEDKMAARLGQLSISNDHCYSSQFRFNPLMKANPTFQEIEDRLQDSSEDESDDEIGPTSKEVTVEITPELKNYLKNQQPVLPESITKTMNKPCTALMLWTPPTIVDGGDLSSVWPDSGTGASEDNKDNSSSDKGSARMETDRPDSGICSPSAGENFPSSHADVFSPRNGVRTDHADDIEVISQGMDICNDSGSMPIDGIESIPDGVVSHESAVNFAGRVSQNNAWQVPRNLMMAASELVDNNNDPGAIDIEGMNDHLQRHIPGVFPQIHNQQVPNIGMGYVAFDSVDDDIDL